VLQTHGDSRAGARPSVVRVAAGPTGSSYHRIWRRPRRCVCARMDKMYIHWRRGEHQRPPV